MNINPYAWIPILPLTALMVSLYFQPAENKVKSWWRDVARFEEDIWSTLGWDAPRYAPRRHSQLLDAPYWVMIGFMWVGSAYSFWQFVQL